MKKKWCLIGVVSIGLAMGFMGGSTVEAAQNNIEILQDVIGEPLDELNVESGTGLGQIAHHFGKLTEFQQQVLASKQARVDELVAQKKLKQAEADDIIQKMKDRQAACDGTGIGGQGAGNGLQDGSGAGIGGQGAGNGLQDGSGASIGGQGAGNGNGTGNQGLGHGGNGQGCGGANQGSCW